MNFQDDFPLNHEQQLFIQFKVYFNPKIYGNVDTVDVCVLISSVNHRMYLRDVKLHSSI